VRGISPTLSGLRLLPLLVGLLLTSITSGLLISKWGRYKGFVIAGTAVLSVGMYVMSQIQVTTSALVLAAMMFVVGAGLGLFMQTLIIAVQNAISMQDMGVGTSAITFFRTLGGAIGAAVLGAVLLDQERVLQAADIAKYGKVLGAAHDFTSAMDRAFLWSVPVAVLAFGLSFFLKEVRLRTSLDRSTPAVGEGVTDQVPGGQVVA
jgi:MFS family permease